MENTKLNNKEKTLELQSLAHDLLPLVLAVCKNSKGRRHWVILLSKRLSKIESALLERESIVSYF